ncbi:hypothetical protein OESDEN_02434 [Oesophagostomum dentatum]|uniref:Uncharacterized protein n=1 Tax=Oesophagostomum dentatum TaxID=61180 RepID=A0A0B1TJ74_OESDE|nr:hypothetical protein OESDEN_02434 [Oesophagostomum dentatum]
MERLYDAIDLLIFETTDALSKPDHIRSIAKDCGLDLTEEQAKDLTSKIVAAFERKFSKGIDKIVKDTKVKEKMSELKELAKACKEKCEETGQTVGYRPVNVGFF